MRIKLVLVATLCLSTAALAHSGVKNPIVKARMDDMAEIGANMKILGEMAKGTRPFDATAARAAAEDITEKAALIPSLFESQEIDPKSEARLNIWDNFDDFTAKAGDLRKAAWGLAPTSVDELRSAMPAIGQTCKACHQVYRE